MPQDLLLGGACHPIDALRWFMGDVEEVHCYGLRGGVAVDYPQQDNFVINLRFASGKIGRVAAFCGVVHPPTLLMNGLGLYGTLGSIVDGRVRLDPEGTVPMREYEITFPNTQRGHGDRDDRDDGAHGRLRHQRREAVGRRTRGRACRGDRPGVLGVHTHGRAGEGPQRLLGMARTTRLPSP